MHYVAAVTCELSLEPAGVHLMDPVRQRTSLHHCFYCCSGTVSDECIASHVVVESLRGQIGAKVGI
jgi:hypothetical protein